LSKQESVTLKEIEEINQFASTLEEEEEEKEEVAMVLTPNVRELLVL